MNDPRTAAHRMVEKYGKELALLHASNYAQNNDRSSLAGQYWKKVWILIKAREEL